MKTTTENIKTYLKFTHQVLGVSHIFTPASNEADAVLGIEAKKIFNFYFWLENRAWSEFSFDNQSSDLKTRFQNVFVFFSDDTDFETRMRGQSEMLSKMNQAIGGHDHNVLLAWLSPNAERDFFARAAQWSFPLRIVFFRETSTAQETIYSSGPHKVLETLSPLVDPNDQQRKRFVWNDFKRLLANS
tara:strand:- start:13167 stop:13727 length:561 start_codon:yes stop_codon:yes gene_type:complete